VTQYIVSQTQDTTQQQQVEHLQQSIVVSQRQFRYVLLAWNLPLRLKRFTSIVGQYEMESKRLSASLIDAEEALEAAVKISNARDGAGEAASVETERYESNVEAVKEQLARHHHSTPENFDACHHWLHEVVHTEIGFNFSHFSAVLLAVTIAAAMFNWDDYRPGLFLAVTVLVSIETVIRLFACMRDRDRLHYWRTPSHVFDTIGVLFMWGSLYFTSDQAQMHLATCSAEAAASTHEEFDEALSHWIDNMYGLFRAATVVRFISPGLDSLLPYMDV